LNGLQQWIHEAEESGIRALQEFRAAAEGIRGCRTLIASCDFVAGVFL
jgi:hypothetical protein